MKNFALRLRFLWTLGALLGSGCFGTSKSVRNDPLPGHPYVTLVPIEQRNSDSAELTSDRITVGIVGQPIERPQFVALLPIKGPAELQCQVSFHRLKVPQTDEHSEETLNVNISYKSPAVEPAPTCSENPSLLHKEVKCQFEKPGDARIVLESANPKMAVGFGLLCRQRRLDAQPIQVARRPVRPIRPANVNRDPAELAHTGASSEPAATLEKRVIGAIEGRDEKHKVLTLSPCKELLPLSKGTAVFAGLRRPFTVNNNRACEIEVADVPDSALDAADLPIKLTQ